MYQKIVSKFQAISFSIIAVLCAFIPILFLPASAGGASMVKGFLLFLGVFLAFSFWLISQFVEGSLRIPKSPVFLALGTWTVLSLVSAFTSVNVSVALWGRGFVFDSFVTTLVLSLFVFLIASFAREQRKLIKLFLVTFAGSALTVFLQIVLYVSQNVPFVSKYLAHVANRGTLVGSWIDFAYFVTFVFLLALLMYEVLAPKGIFKKISLLTMIVSLVALVFLNFKTAWIITVLSSLIVFVYKSSVERSLKARFPSVLSGEDEMNEEKAQFPLMSLVALLVGLFFFLSSSSIGVGISRFAGIAFNDVRPSFASTTTVMRSSLYHDPLFGVGAGRYTDAWHLYHPDAINNSLFWNADFESGFNLIQSVATTNGVLPTIALLAVLIFALVHGFRLFNCQFADRFTRFIAVASLVMSLAFVTLFFFAAPGLVLITCGFVYIGLLFGVSSLVGKTKVVTVEYLKDPRTSFFAILVLVVATMVSFSAVYFTGNKFASIVLYNRALAATDPQKADIYLSQAITLSNSDIYWKSRTALYVNQFNAEAAKGSPDKNELQKFFTQAEQSAQQALLLDKENASNWLVLSQVYQLIADASNTDAISNATAAAAEAQKRSPHNPLYFLNNARIDIIRKDAPAALENINRALTMKPNYLDAFLLKGQIEVAQGDSSAIKTELLKYIALAPYDDQGYILLGQAYGALKDNTAALDAFTRAHQLAPGNASNYLTYISALLQSGNKTKAVEELELFKKQFPKVEGVDEQINRIQNGL